MIMEAAANVICPFLGSVGFAIMFNIPRRYYFASGMTGAAGWVVYKLMLSHASVAVASFVGTLVIVLMSRMLTVKMKCPITLFLISGIVPLVPGAGVYYTAYYLVTNQMDMAGYKGLESVKIAFGIVLGIVFVVSIPREVFHGEYWKNRKRLFGKHTNA